MNPTTTATDSWVNAALADPCAVRIAGASGTARDRYDLRSPIDSAVITTVGTGGTADAEAAVDAAAQALPMWSGLSVDERSAALRRIADELSVAADSGWPELICRETGKRLAEARAELGMSATYFRVFADLAEEQRSERFDAVPGHLHTTDTRPVGVVAALSPWNFPVSIPARKIAAALAAGCTVVAKPSELAPLSSLVLAAAIEQHLPAGTVNTVLGPPADIVEPWLADPRLGAVTFTGSTRVGRLVAAGAAPRFLRTVLELGGCAPFVVLPDADPEQAAAVLMVAKFRNNGQSCIAANQIFIAEEIAGDVVDALTAAVDDLVIGDPRLDGTGLGPLAPAGDPDRMRALVADATGRGAQVTTGPRDLPQQGHFVAPTVLTGVDPASPVATEEIFGPVAAVQTFRDVDSVLDAHYATGYGLAGYVCAGDVGAAQAVAERFRAGIVGINTGTPNYPGVPFGGTGLSGLGYEGGRLGLQEFQHIRTTTVGGR